MIRDPKLYDNCGAQRHTDRVLVENLNEATRWISVGDHQVINFSIHPGKCVETVYPEKCCRQPNPRKSLVTDPHCDTGATACVILERKFGGWRDDEAQIVERVDLVDDVVNLHTHESGRGFFRLRVDAAANADGKLDQPLILFMQRLKHRDF